MTASASDEPIAEVRQDRGSRLALVIRPARGKRDMETVRALIRCYLEERRIDLRFEG